MTDAVIFEKIIGLEAATVITLNKEMEDFVKIVKSLEECGVLIKDGSKNIKYEANEEKSEFLRKLLGAFIREVL